MYVWYLMGKGCLPQHGPAEAPLPPHHTWLYQNISLAPFFIKHNTRKSRSFLLPVFG